MITHLIMLFLCVHHLSTHNRRKAAVDECYRILKPGGKLLISAWSESEKYGSGDQFISWNNSEKRYYHMFNEKSFLALFESNSNVNISCYKHNYYGVIQKKISNFF